MKYFILYFEHEIDGQIGYGLLQLLTNRLIWITFKFTWDQLIKGLKTGKKTHLKATENRVMHTNLLVLRCWCLDWNADCEKTKMNISLTEASAVHKGNFYGSASVCAQMENADKRVQF